jgi:hypothetical protein
MCRDTLKILKTCIFSNIETKKDGSIITKDSAVDGTFKSEKENDYHVPNKETNEL